ncbi:hypothetical protein CH35J_010897 [Colletotrichum higginsianum]|uniref:Tat pathway signal sequence n=1 Tax=Colletotrichum higginsianum TaxID=80884 RepID=A0A4V4NAD2_9PEZI|nr:hypothetical protein CH35J_010897 [Colletotrichum higginsianum]
MAAAASAEKTTEDGGIDSASECHESEHMLLDHDNYNDTRASPERRGQRWNGFWLLPSGFLLVSVLAFTAGYLYRERGYVKCMYHYDNPDLLPKSILSYLRSGGGQSAKVFEPTWHIGQPPTEPWARPPGPDVEAFWDQLMRPHSFLITREDMVRLGKDPDRYVSIPPDWGYGDRVFPTVLDTHHQMHCLNVLRKMIYRHVYFPNMTTLGDGEARHCDHCLKMLYEGLACHNSWDVFNMIWIEDYPHPVAEMSRSRQCRPLDDLWRFARENNVIDDARLQLLMPSPGAYAHPQFPGNKKVPKVSEEDLDEQRKKFDAVLEQWRSTGEIPRQGEFAGDAVV